MGEPNIVPTLNNRILIIRTPKEGTPNFRKLPYYRTSYISDEVHEGIVLLSTDTLLALNQKPEDAGRSPKPETFYGI